MKERLIELIAKGKLIQQRVASYGQFYKYALLISIFYSTFPNQEIALLFIVIGSLVVVILAFLDFFIIYPKELELIFQMNPEWNRKWGKNEKL